MYKQTLKLISFLLLFSSVIYLSCTNKSDNRNYNNKNFNGSTLDKLDYYNDSIIQVEKDSHSKTYKKESELTVGWNTPFLTPVGSDISRVIRAYYMVGDYENMLKFIVYPNCYSKEEIKGIIRQSKWGYEIQATNLHWNSDSSFILTIKTNVQKTMGAEQYYGKMINDTGKLVLFPEKETLFTYDSVDSVFNPCETKTIHGNNF